MRISLHMRRRLRSAICAGVWLGSVAVAAWLYGNVGGPTAAVAVAETKSYRVSPDQFGRLASLEVTEGQLVTAGQVIARVDTQLVVQEKVRMQARREQSVLRASTTSYVSTIHARPGDVLHAGDPIVTLVETRTKQAVAYLDEKRGAVLTQGSKVIARRHNESGEQVFGTVAAIAGDIAELPQRVRSNPHVPMWGRAVYITLPENSRIAPGELLEIMTPDSSTGVTNVLAF